jgi:hypothetical protein
VSKYPENAKLGRVAGKTQAIGEFVDWLEAEKGIHLAVWASDTRMVPAGASIQNLLAEWAGIDQNKLEDERRAMLAAVRAANERGD